MLLGLLFLFLVSTVCYCQKSECPEFNPADECTCRTAIDDELQVLVVRCRNLESENALERIVKSLRGKIVFELEIANSALKYLPHDAFVNTTIEVVSFHNSTIGSLSDSNLAFKGLESSMHLLEMVNCTYTGDWDWTQLFDLHDLLEINIADSDMPDITVGLSDIAHIKMVSLIFPNDGIQSLADDAFSAFVSLARLTLDANKIRLMKRSMLPYPALELKILGLSNNKLTDLPEDLFTYMPKLRNLYLSGNPLQTLHEVTFKPIWKNLYFLLFYDSQLSCDCRISWLTKEYNRNEHIYAECEGPEGFKGRRLNKLKEEDLLCDS